MFRSARAETTAGARSRAIAMTRLSEGSAGNSPAPRTTSVDDAPSPAGSARSGPTGPAPIAPCPDARCAGDDVTGGPAGDGGGDAGIGPVGAAGGGPAPTGCADAEAP